MVTQSSRGFSGNGLSSPKWLRKLQQKFQNQSLGELIKSALEKTLDALILLRYRLQYPHVKFGSKVRIRGKFSIEGKGKVEIGNNCVFTSFEGKANKILLIDPSGCVTIGDHCFFNSTYLKVEGKGHIEIGDHAYFNAPQITATDSLIQFKKQCMVSDATIFDTDYHSIQINRRNPEVKVKSKSIVVEDNVWIASQSMILRGVTIGKNSVIGARAVVRKSVPDNVVVIGDPQQIVKELDTTIKPYQLSA
jgi:acetyltransferase-like isoleucine patch superfamily enzyme